MSTEQTKAAFDPANGPTLTIKPVKNGWIIYDESESLNFARRPLYVFQTAGGLANAVESLVQSGTVVRPTPCEDKLKELFVASCGGFSRISEFEIPLKEADCGWFVFSRPGGIFHRFVCEHGSCSDWDEPTSSAGHVCTFIRDKGITHFRRMTDEEAEAFCAAH